MKEKPKWLIELGIRGAQGGVAGVLVVVLILLLLVAAGCSAGDTAELLGAEQRKLCESSLSSPHKRRLCHRWGYTD